MNKIDVAVLHESHECPAGMMMFLAKLTQRGHTISSMKDLNKLYDKCMGNHQIAKDVAKLPHGAIKRFAPITIAVVGASRRFLAQARTHQVGLDFVSASLQYSDYSNKAGFVVPYEVIKQGQDEINRFLGKCASDLQYYNEMVMSGYSNDTAGYSMNQALRNILIIQGNHQSWDYFIRLRGCNRNTEETQYVTCKIWDALQNTTSDGMEMFAWAGPDCLHGQCREGTMSCKTPLKFITPKSLMNYRWPLIKWQYPNDVKLTGELHAQPGRFEGEIK